MSTDRTGYVPTWLARLGWLLAAAVTLALGSLTLTATFICGVELYAETQAHSFSFWAPIGALAAGTATIAAGAALRRFAWAAVRPVEGLDGVELPTGAIRRGGA